MEKVTKNFLRKNDSVIKKQNLIDPQFLLTFQSLFLVDRFGFYFEAITPWDNAIALSIKTENLPLYIVYTELAK